MHPRIPLEAVTHPETVCLLFYGHISVTNDIIGKYVTSDKKI